MSIPSTPPAPTPSRLTLDIAADLGRERRRRAQGIKLPPGSLGPSLRNTLDAIEAPREMLLDHYERYGGVFTLRTLHEQIVYGISATATHQITVAEADAFSWREGRFRDLHPLLGDGMLNIDGAHHKGFRRLLLPAFHREHVESLTNMVIREALAAADRLDPGATVDMYAWTRDVAMRIALRALLGLELDRRAEHEIAEAFEQALSLYGQPVYAQILRGPGTPYARALAGRRAFDRYLVEEIARRRERGEPGPGVIGMLLGATDEAGNELPADVVRDHVATILFAGHDTTTATLTFLLYELGCAPAARAALEDELTAEVSQGVPDPAQLGGKALPVLERTLMETLRRWPPAWIGPRRAVRDVVLDGHEIPAGIGVHYCSWATHHIPDLWPDPLAFDPDRFTQDRILARPKGAYVPFGAGSRICLGKRFGELELRALIAVLLSRFRFALDPARPLRVTTTPTLGPKDGLRFAVTRR